MTDKSALVNTGQKFASKLQAYLTNIETPCTGNMSSMMRQSTSKTAPAPPATPIKPQSATKAQTADPDTSMADAPIAEAQYSSASTQGIKKRKRKEKEMKIFHQATFRRPTWSYFHLTLVTPGTAVQPLETHNIDALTVSTLLLQPLTAYLGTTGSAVPIDILHTRGPNAYIRIPRQDAKVFRAGLSGWIGGCDTGSVLGTEEGGRIRVAWRIVAEGGSLGLLAGGEEFFGKDSTAY